MVLLSCLCPAAHSQVTGGRLAKANVPKHCYKPAGKPTRHKGVSTTAALCRKYAVCSPGITWYMHTSTPCNNQMPKQQYASSRSRAQWFQNRGTINARRQCVQCACACAGVKAQRVERLCTHCWSIGGDTVPHSDSYRECLLLEDCKDTQGTSLTTCFSILLLQSLSYTSCALLCCCAVQYHVVKCWAAVQCLKP